MPGFQIGLGVLLIIISSILYRIRTLRLSRKNDELRETVKEQAEELEEVVEELREKYVNSSADETVMNEYLGILRKVMEEKKPYLDDSLSIRQLFELTDIPSHHISQTLSSILDLNFYRFINSYRLKEVKAMLSDPKYKEMNILRIASEAGFRSKTSFNAFFKKTEGMTPREYREKYIK
jgi:AraC-like DNA-binding protein